MDFATLLGSSVLAALVAALVSLRNNERKLSLQYITGERATWRDKIREIALAVFDASIKRDGETIRRYRFEFSHLLHLGDLPDDEILSNLVELEARPDDAEALNDFRIRISLLLKYEWEKAKLEAKPVAPVEQGRKLLSKMAPKWFERETANRTSLEAFKQSANKANAADAWSSHG
ncbi:hypothetical protein [Desulfocastanea catecholica]